MSEKKTGRSVLGPRGRRKLGLAKGENYKDPGGHQSGNLGSQSVSFMEVKKQSSPGEARAEVKKPQQTGKGGKGGLRLSSEADNPSSPGKAEAEEVSLAKSKEEVTIEDIGPEDDLFKFSYSNVHRLFIEQNLVLRLRGGGADSDETGKNDTETKNT